MTSGTRKPPPISTSSPRETITSRPAASAESISSVGGGVVVDDDGRLGAGELGRAAVRRGRRGGRGAAVEVVFESAYPRPIALMRASADVAERRASEVGVDDHAGGVDHRFERAIVTSAPAVPRPRSIKRVPVRVRVGSGAGAGAGRDPASARTIAAAASARSASTTASRPYAASRPWARGGLAKLLDRRDQAGADGLHDSFRQSVWRAGLRGSRDSGYHRAAEQSSQPACPDHSEPSLEPIDPVRPRLDPEPAFRPDERFWPYVELPEEPSNEELAALDPDLHAALFGSKRPFSLTIVFPALRRARLRAGARRWPARRTTIAKWDWARRFDREPASGRTRRRRCAICFSSSSATKAAMS